MYETWTKSGDAEFIGKIYMLKGNDTTIFENIRLIQKQGSLFYIPTVKDQNNNLPVSFSSKSISDNEFIFEHQNHDFPQIIYYRRVSLDSLVTEISGTRNLQNRKQTFPMKRIK